MEKSQERITPPLPIDFGVQLKAHVDEIEKGYLARADSNRIAIKRVMTWTKAMLVLVIVILLFGGFFTVKAINDTSTLAHKVQDQRTSSILTSCQEGNLRHDRTIAKLQAISQTARAHASPAQKRRIDQSINDSILLINDLQPKYDCQARLKKLNTTQ